MVARLPSRPAVAWLNNPRRKSQWQGWIVAIVVLVCADLVAAEFFWRTTGKNAVTRLERRYRVASPIYHHGLKPSYSGIAAWGPLRYPIRTNSLGFRDYSTRIVPLAVDRPRVLLIGDSFTEGLGLAYEQTYAGMITRELDRQGVDVLNASAESYSPTIYFSKVRHLLEKVGLKFDELVVFIDISDIEDEAKNYLLLEDGTVFSRDTVDSPDLSPKPETRLVAVKGFLKRHSVVVRTLDLLKDRLLDAVTGEKEPSLPAPPPITKYSRALWTVRDSLFEAFGRAGLDSARKGMDLLASLLKQHEIVLTVVVYPWPDQVISDSAQSLQVVFWKQWAEQAGAQFIDLFPPFFQSTDGEATIRRYYIPDDVHFNEAGSLLITEHFLRHFRESPSAGR